MKNFNEAMEIAHKEFVDQLDFIVLDWIPSRKIV